jgi:flagellar motor switch protein FliG
MDRILVGGNANGIETLKWMDSRSIADMIRNEHPQIIAIVLSYLDSDQSAEVLQFLPQRQRPDIMLRIATLDTVQPQALNELNQILERQVSGSTVQSSAVGGVRSAANILNYLDSAMEQEIMEQVKESDAELSQQIEDLMFVFENLGEVDDMSIQAMLREVSSDTLLVALKGAHEGLREKFFKNMSKRAAEMLRDDLEAKGPVRVSEVEAAQKEILSIARRMAEEGTISLGGAGGEEYV